MNLYLVRHGQSEGNALGKNQGPDVPLSKEGIKQASVLAERLKSKKIDIIYASTFLRARETAEIISKKLKLEVEYWEELRERKRPSQLQGLSLDDPVVLMIDKKISENFHDPDFRYSDDESYNDLKKRAQGVTEHLLKNHISQNVLCVSHVGFMKMIVMSLLFEDKLKPKMFWQFYYHSWFANTGITHMECSKKQGWRLLTWNDVTHL